MDNENIQPQDSLGTVESTHQTWLQQSVSTLAGTSVLVAFLALAILSIEWMGGSVALFKDASLATPTHSISGDSNTVALATTLPPEETDRLIVKFKEQGLPPGLSVAQAHVNLEKAEGLRKLAVINGINATVYQTPADSTAKEVVDRIKTKQRDLIEYAEVDMKVSPAYLSNDPYYGNEWHLPKIQADVAWDRAKGYGVTVASIDTGVDCTHPDLAAQCTDGFNTYDGNTDSHDVSGHGTLTAGTFGAIGDNAEGVVGVSYQSKIMPIRVSFPDGNGFYYSDVAEGVVWAADHGARVVNASTLTAGVTTVEDAGAYLRQKGGILINSAGNGGADMGYANSPSMIVVGATDMYDNRTSWSNYGTALDIVAPGVGIYTTVKGGGYSGPSGTSVSAPIISGVLALEFSVNPALTPDQAQSILFSTADDLGTPGWDMYYGWGRVNAAKAVALAASTTGSQINDTQAPSVPTNLKATNIQATSVTLSWSTSVDNVGVVAYDVYRNSVKIGSATSPQYIDSTVASETTYTYTVAARDNAGNISTQSTPVSATTPTAPLAVTSQSVSLKSGTTATINSTTNKPATVVVKYGLTSSALTSTASGGTTTATSQTTNLTGLKAKTKYFYQVVATDATGATAVSSISNFRTLSR